MAEKHASDSGRTYHPIKIVQVDAFADAPFTGNPAAVCVLQGPADDAWMQQVAAEMNLSETAFLYPESGGYLLRWFTPAVEVDLCGHATLASAHVLWEEGYLARDKAACFHTKSGPLTATRAGDWIEMDFPALRFETCPAPVGLAEALGKEILRCAISRFDVLAELASEDEVRGIDPDFNLLRSVKARGVIATARSTSGPYDFVSRFFAPSAGVNEDPVTGSAHCCLAPYWAERWGRTTLVGYQASRRGGVVRMVLTGDRVALGGQAITTMRGELTGCAVGKAVACPHPEEAAQRKERRNALS